MILQALYDYYLRKGGMAPYGFEHKEIPFLLVIDPQGKFIRIEDTREKIEKKLYAKEFLVPKSYDRTGKNSYETAFLFWDHYGYVLANPKDQTQKEQEQARKQNKTFIKNIQEVCQKFPDNDQFKAVTRFYTHSLQSVFDDPLWEECLKIPGCNLSFKIDGQEQIVAEHPDLNTLVETTYADQSTRDPKAICLITGEKTAIAKLHTATSVPGGKSGGKLVGFQKKAGYDSYGKEQGTNAPVSLRAEAAYTTALKQLLNKKSRNKFALDNTIYLFWSSSENPFENSFASLFAAPPKDDPDRNIQEIRDLLQAIYSGKFDNDSDTRFYLLGLSPNAARISVSVWQCEPLRNIARNIAAHFEGLKMVRDQKDEREYFSLFNLLTQLAFDYKLDNLPPVLAGATIRAILNGTPYPELLQQCCLRRIRADRKIGYIRAALLKAFLNRKHQNHSQIKPITMELDKNSNHPAYQCGRLFAVLENVQQRAAGSKLNATIKDRYYTAASATPATIFGRLISLSNHHLSKLNGGAKTYFEKLIGEIMGGIDDTGFPRYLGPDDQSRFAIGYYHQRNDLYASKKETDGNTETWNEEEIDNEF